MEKAIDVDFAEIDALIEEKYHKNKEALVMILQDITGRYNYIPPEVLPHVARKLHLPLSRVFSVATFYKAFSLEPRGKYIVSVCTGTACHVRGAQGIMKSLHKDLKIKEGETTDDLMFTLESVRCMGCCASGPVIRVNKDTHGGLDPERIVPVIEQYKEGSS
ncbi:MAG: NADH-quinone oxidoreductase subunit NuoE [Thermodesulfobacteriota bacterium]|nr:NADH-quinone oxidoreductase subunit NuoE [Thermodesulfobacteriota bacterium]